MAKIFNLTEASFLALHCCAILANSDRRMNAHELGTLIESSENHITKVMQRLHRAGFVDSLRGPTGGYQITFDPEKVSLLDIYQALEGKLDPTYCPFDRTECPFSGCNFASKMKGISSQFVSALNETMVSDFIEKNSNSYKEAT